MDPSLEPLLLAIRRGDRAAFEREMVPFRDLLVRLVEEEMDRRLLAVLEPEDVVQDVLIITYRELGELDFPSPGAFRRWIEMVTRNRLIDLVRRHYTTRVHGTPPRSLDQSNGHGGHVKSDVASPELTPGSVASRREAAEALLTVVAGLAPDYRTVLQLVLVDRLGSREIALRIGRSQDATRKLLARALDACRDAMRKLGFEVE